MNEKPVMPVVDAIDLDKQPGVACLILSDQLPWDGTHLYALQDKINSYLAFIQSGELFLSYPQTMDLDIKIDVIMQFKPTEEVLAFLRQAESIIEESGILFGYGPSAGGYVDGE
jgi:hypothetical protein